jgi:hypothetical protein
MEKMNYKGWPNCYHLTNSLVDLVVTTDVGPRIIRYGLLGKENEFKEFPEQVGQMGGDVWQSFGGHRLWHAPEDLQRTYFPDNSPISFQPLPNGIKLIQPIETTTGIQKEIEITLSPKTSQVHLVHRMRNMNQWAIELAAWALSVMTTGGTAILPLPPRGLHTEILVPTSSLSIWAYTAMADPRWTWGNKYILLRQDPGVKSPQKIGAFVPDGWMGYARGGHLFLKKTTSQFGVTYPDFGCSMETFTNDQLLEVESLSPITRLDPGSKVEHIEDWYLFDNVPVPQNDEEVSQYVIPKLQQTLD